MVVTVYIFLRNETRNLPKLVNAYFSKIMKSELPHDVSTPKALSVALSVQCHISVQYDSKLIQMPPNQEKKSPSIIYSCYLCQSQILYKKYFFVGIVLLLFVPNLKKRHFHIYILKNVPPF